MYIKKEQIEKARNADTVEVLLRLGFELKKCGKDYQLIEHDSLKVSRTKGWIWNSRNMGGNAIDFLMQYPGLNYPFKKAVSKILSLDSEEATKKAEGKVTAAFRLPIPYIDNRKVVDYLCRVRAIDEEIIKRCINEKKLYESGEYHNAVFVGFDELNRPAYAFQRGTYPEKKWAGEVEGSDKRYAFCLKGKIETVLHVFEASIDLLSYMTIFPSCIGTMLSLGGTSLKALEHYIDNNHVLTIYVHTDNDEGGQKCYSKINKVYGTQGISVIPGMPAKMKDWNLMLLKESENT